MTSMQRGFTLMELVIAMVIIGILTAIAIPNYTEYIRRTNRAEARGQLLAVAHWMEKWRTQNGRFDDPGNANNPPPVPPFPVTLLQSPPTGAARYTIAIAATPATYTVTATATGTMTGDVCTTLTINETGIRNFTTGGGGTQDICWNR